MKIKHLLLTTSLLSVSFAASFGLSASAMQKDPSLTDAFNTNLRNNVKEKDEVFIEADQVDYDMEQSIVVAAGKVEILKGETVLFADTISYNQNTNVVVAEGNVVISGPAGNAIFTDRFVLTDDLKDGVIDYFRARLSDGSLIASAQARRLDGKRIELTKAVYSPCPVCNLGLDEDPQWQLKAETVVIDEDEQTITYRDAFLEIYGMPILYTPYFSHPSPDADRKSGLLPPVIGSDSNLGATLQLSYYWNVSPDMDFTFKPIITSDEGVVLGGEFRHLTNYGEYNFDGSITRPDKLNDDGNPIGGDETRGHLKGFGRFDVSENWDLGFEGQIASDDTYLRRYNFDNSDLLNSRGYLERVEDRDYSILQTVYFQGLLESDNNDIIPFAPIYTRNFVESEKGIIPGFSESRLWTKLNGFAVQRDIGDENQRLSSEFGLTVPHITKGGQIFEFTAAVRGDYFNQDDNILGTNSEEERVIPEASFSWSYPMINDFGNGSQLIVEPIAKVVVAPNSNYNENIVNEDSQDTQFSDLNLFSNNKFRGIDRVENGTRFHYGLKGGLYQDDVKLTYTLGQNYRVKDDNSFSVNSGLNDNVSDYVGRVGLDLYNTLDFSYRFRFDKEDFQARRSEVDANLDLDRVKVNLGYIFLDFDVLDPTEDREEIAGNAEIGITNDWSVILGGRRNLGDNSNVDAYAGLGYEGDCINITTRVKKEFISDRDVDAGLSFDVQIGLKNLGNL